MAAESSSSPRRRRLDRAGGQGAALAALARPAPAAGAWPRRALSMGLIAVLFSLHSNPAFARIARRAIDEVLADCDQD